MQIIDDWLEDWLFATQSRRFFSPAATDSDSDASQIVERLCREAVADGYDLRDLQEACCGDVRHFVESHLVRLPASLPTRGPASLPLA